jgi:hypothetical protein
MRNVAKGITQCDDAEMTKALAADFSLSARKPGRWAAFPAALTMQGAQPSESGADATLLL